MEHFISVLAGKDVDSEKLAFAWTLKLVKTEEEAVAMAHVEWVRFNE